MRNASLRLNICISVYCETIVFRTQKLWFKNAKPIILHRKLIDFIKKKNTCHNYRSMQLRL